MARQPADVLALPAGCVWVHMKGVRFGAELAWRLPCGVFRVHQAAIVLVWCGLSRAVSGELASLTQHGAWGRHCGAVFGDMGSVESAARWTRKRVLERFVECLSP